MTIAEAVTKALGSSPEDSRKGAIMMFSYRLVRLIETHADTLAAGLEKKVLSSAYVTASVPFPPMNCGNASTRYIVIWAIGCWGRTRRILNSATGRSARGGHTGGTTGRVIQVIVLTKENLWDFLKSEAVLDRAVEIMGELELLQMLEQFFDRAIYFAAVGYQEQRGVEAARA